MMDLFANVPSEQKQGLFGSVPNESPQSGPVDLFSSVPPEAPAKQSLLVGTLESVPAGTVQTAATVPRGIGALTYSLLPQDTPETVDLAKRIFAAQGNEAALSALTKEAATNPHMLVGALAQSAIERAKKGELKAPPTLSQGTGSIADMPGIRIGKLMEQFADEKFPVSPENQQRILPQIASAVGSTIAMLPAAALGPLALVVETGISGAGQSQAQAEQGGATSAQQAQAAVEGMAPGLLDAIPLENLVRPIAHLPIEARSAIARAFRGAIEQAAVEGGTEGVQQFLQNVIAWQIYNPKQALSEGVLDNIVAAGAAGAIFGAPAGTLHGHRESAKTAKEAVANEPLPTRILPQPAQPEEPVPGAQPSPPGPVVPGEIATPPPNAGGQSGPTVAPGMVGGEVSPSAPTSPQPQPESAAPVPENVSPPVVPQPETTPTTQPQPQEAPAVSTPQSEGVAAAAPEKPITNAIVPPQTVAPTSTIVPSEIITTPGAKTRAIVTGEVRNFARTGTNPQILDYVAAATLNEKGGSEKAIQNVAAANPGMTVEDLTTVLADTSPYKFGKLEAPTFYLPADTQFGPTDVVRGTFSPQAAQEFANTTGKEYQAFKLKAGASKVQFGNIAYAKGQDLSVRPIEEGPKGYAKQFFERAERAAKLTKNATMPEWFAKKLTNGVGRTFYSDIGNAAESSAESMKGIRDVNFGEVQPEDLKPGKAYFSGYSDPAMMTTPIGKASLELVEKFAKRFLAHSSVVLRLGASEFPNPRGEKGSYATRLTDGVYLINIAKEDIAKGKLTLFHSLVHEFGHVVQYAHYAQTSTAVRAALRNSYNDWLRTVAKSDPQAFAALYGGPGEDRFTNVPVGLSTGQFLSSIAGKPGAFDYIFSFQEWFANQVAIYLQKDFLAQEDHSPTVKSFFESLVTKLKEFFNFAYKDVKPSLGVEAMMHWSAATSEVYRLGNTFKPLTDGMPASLEVLPDSPAGSIQEEQLSAPMDEKKMPPTQGGELARFTKLQELGYSLLQIGKRYPTLQGLQNYIQLAQDFWAKKMEVAQNATEVVEAWNKLGKGKGQALSKFLYDVTLDSLSKGRRLTNAELAAHGTRNNLTPEGFQVFQQIDQSFQSVLTELEQALVASAHRTFTQPLLLQTELQRIQAEFGKLRAQNYFPLTRFGKYYIRMEATAPIAWGGKTFKAGDTMLFETFENETARNTRQKALEDRMKNSAVDIKGRYMPESGFAFQGFPISLLDSMKLKLGLTQTQLAELEKLVVNLSPGQSFKQHMLSRRGVAGFTQDAMRAYASYMMSASGHIARLTYRDQMFQATKDVGAVVAAGRGQDVPGKLEQYLGEHWQYLNNPGEEWASIKSGLFTVFLGMNVKSAFVNLTQIPLVAMPFFASRFGDVRAAATVSKAMADTVAGIRQGSNAISAAERALIAQGVKDGFIKESFASDLAGAAQGSTLDRMLPLVGFAQVTRKLGFLSSYMFQRSEEFNRRAVFLAALRLSNNDYAFARDAVQTTMFEYNRWAKPKIMRGRKSVLFAFLQYTQHMLWFMGNDKGASRLWLAMALAAGVQGLPFADDLLDLIEGASGFLSRLLGYSNPLVDIRKDMRDLFNQAGLNPDLMMHGLSRYSMGLALFGSPFPAFDLSGSFSMGQLVPGVQPISKALKTGSMDVNQLIAQSATDVGGAGPAVVARILQAAVSNNPDMIQRWQGALPTAAQSVVRAIQYGKQGGVINNLGDKIVSIDPYDPHDFALLAGQFFGFRPTKVATMQEKLSAQRDAAVYYSTRKTDLLNKYFYARKNADREAIADVNRAIDRYNKEVPFPELRLTYQDRAQSYHDRLIAQRRRELGMGPARQDIRLYRSYNPAYPAAQ